MSIDLEPFDTAKYRRFRVQNTRGEFNWNHDVAAFSDDRRSEWQNAFRARFSHVLGNLNGWEKPALAPRTLETRQLDGYRRETVAFTSRPGLQAVGYLLIPEDCAEPRPALICLPGHGRGAGSTIGIASDGSQRALPPLTQKPYAPPLDASSSSSDASSSDASSNFSSAPDAQGAPEYEADFALQCVRRGYVVFALETIGFGLRRDAQTQRERAAGDSTCAREAMAALMLGETLPGWRVRDTQRALDLLQTRPEIDANRLGVMGISGGGLVALFTAALDTRIAMCVVSCYFNSFADSVLAIDHCSDNYVPGLLNVCEMPDLAALVAPRALFCEGGRLDPIFPVAAFEKAVSQAREIYNAFGCSQNFDAETFEGGHLFHGQAAFEFLKRLK